MWHNTPNINFTSAPPSPIPISPVWTMPPSLTMPVAAASSSSSKISQTNLPSLSKRAHPTATTICFTTFSSWPASIKELISTSKSSRTKYYLTIFWDGRLSIRQEFKFRMSSSLSQMSATIIQDRMPSYSTCNSHLKSSIIELALKPFSTVLVYGVPSGESFSQSSHYSSFLTIDANSTRKIQNGASSKNWKAQ